MLWCGDRVPLCPQPSGQRWGSRSHGLGGTTAHVGVSFHCHPQGSRSTPSPRWNHPQGCSGCSMNGHGSVSTPCPWQLCPRVCSSLKTGRRPQKAREPPKSSPEPIRRSPGAGSPLPRANKRWFTMICLPNVPTRKPRSRLHLAPGEG